jgi:hypothetical protein
MVNQTRRIKKVEEVKLLKLDLGCGTRKQEGFIGVDKVKGEKVDVVCDLGRGRWPWKNNSVGEVFCSHMLEHLKPLERINFANELWRVLAPGAKAKIITPNWASNRAYGDLTHEWPPVCEMWYLYLCKSWREENAQHNDVLGYRCDFELPNWDYILHQNIVGRPQEYIIHALSFWKEAAMDLITILTCKKEIKK